MVAVAAAAYPDEGCYVVADVRVWVATLQPPLDALLEAFRPMLALRIPGHNQLHAEKGRLWVSNLLDQCCLHRAQVQRSGVHVESIHVSPGRMGRVVVMMMVVGGWARENKTKQFEVTS